MAYYVKTNSFDRIALLEDLQLTANSLSVRRLNTVFKFAKQISEIHDVDAIDTFLNWKDHPVLDTILMLVSELDEDEQYEILDKAEDLIKECTLNVISNQ